MITRLLNKQFFAVKANLELLKKIREETSAPINQIKTALEESQNSYEQALQWLKKKGMSVAEKHADKTTREGVIAVAINQKRNTGVMLEVNCETDFVAKSQLFLKFVDKLLHTTLESSTSPINFSSLEKEQENVKATDSLLERMTPMKVFDDNCANALEEKKYLISKVQENVKVRRMLRIYNPQARLGSYVHREYQSGIGLQGCIAELLPESENPQPEDVLNEFCDNIAIQVLGSPPKFISENDIPEALLNEEKQKVLETMAAALAKAPAESHERIIQGKLKSTLLAPYVFPYMGYILSSEGQKTVGQYWKQIERELNTKIKLGTVEAWKCK